MFFKRITLLKSENVVLSVSMKELSKIVQYLMKLKICEIWWLTSYGPPDEPL